MKKDRRVTARRQPDPVRQTVTTAKRLVRRHASIVGVDYGYVYEEGVRTGEIGIRYHVPRKLPRSRLAAEDRLPTRIDGMRVDVLESGFKPHQTNPFAPAARMQPGLSIGNVPRRSDGTLGLFVKDHDDALCLLSNWHVLCGGDNAQQSDPISQPGPLFLGPNAPHVIAQLRRWIPPARRYDVAIAVLMPDVRSDPTLLGDTTSVSGLADPTVGATVVKAGAATGVTHAMVDAINGSYLVPYEEFGDTTRWMLGIRLVPHPDFQDRDVSLPGDSGAAWLDAATGGAVALNFAGEDDGAPTNEYALAHPMSSVCELLGVRVA